MIIKMLDEGFLGIENYGNVFFSIESYRSNCRNSFALYERKNGRMKEIGSSDDVIEWS